MSNGKQDLRAFVLTGHGQSEGDSVHSCTSKTIKTKGNVEVPSQLAMLIGCANKRCKPYLVIQMDWTDFLDFKKK